MSFIAAYIAVIKGSDIGTDSLYAQQCTIHENKSVKRGVTPKSFYPQIHAIKILNQIIMELQQKHHAIILMLDANQTPAECYQSKKLKPFSIEWLKLQRGMDDPFVQLVNQCPNSTTLTPNRDIDYKLTFGINIPVSLPFAPTFLPTQITLQ